MQLLFAMIAAYLLGSLPFSFFVARRVRGIDLRQHGSGNLGATNIFRTLGPWWGVFVLLLDMAKGAAAVLLMSWAVTLWPEDRSLPLHLNADVWRILSGALASFGHTFSPFVSFQGGKGVATTAGCFLVLAPYPILAALTVFALVFGISRIVSLGSICAAAVLPVAVVFFELKSEDFSWTIMIFTVAIATWVVLRHRANIERLQNGTENQLVAGGRDDEPAATESGSEPVDRTEPGGEEPR